MLTPEQRTAFEVQGHVHLPGAFDATKAEAMADRVWAYLRQHRGVQRDDRQTWKIPGPWVGLKVLKDDPLFQGIGSPVLCAAIDSLLGQGAWRKPKNWGGFLVSFPNCDPADWNIPAQGWHVDAHFTHEPGTPFALRVFAFMSRVQPRGGGTLVVRGSHRLVEAYVRNMTPEDRQGGYAALRDRFNVSHPWLAELTTSGVSDPSRIERFTNPGQEIDGVQVQVDQLCGSPGDVVLAHPWFLHALSPNAGNGPRLMCAKDIPNERLRAAPSRRPAMAT